MFYYVLNTFFDIFLITSRYYGNRWAECSWCCCFNKEMVDPDVMLHNFLEFRKDLWVASWKLPLTVDGPEQAYKDVRALEMVSLLRC